MPMEISAGELATQLQQGEAIHLLDVRLPGEHQLVALTGSQLIPLQELPLRWREIDPKSGRLVVYCHHGVRSWQAALFLEQQGFQHVASLQGGIDSWAMEVDPSLPRY